MQLKEVIAYQCQRCFSLMLDPTERSFNCKDQACPAKLAIAEREAQAEWERRLNAAAR